MKTLFAFLMLMFGLFAGTSLSSAQWIQTGGPDDGILVLHITPSGPNIVAGTQDKGMFLSSDGGAHWNHVSNGFPDSGTVTFIHTFGTTLIAGVGNWGNFFHSTENGESWTAEHGIGPNIIAMVSKESKMFALDPSAGVFVSSDGGSLWTFAGSGLPNADARSLVTDGSGLFAGTESHGIYLSTNDGASWEATDNIGLRSGTLWSLAILDSTLFAGSYGDGVFRSTDRGAHWTAVDSGLTNLWVLSLVVSGNNLFAVCNGGDDVFLSMDKGRSWKPITTALGDTNVRCLAVVGPELYIGTYGHGVWKRPVSEVITNVTQDLTETPRVYPLLQNYPNPFNPSTCITFSLTKRSFVSLKVFDLTGREVATIVSEQLSAGTHTKVWNAEALPSGVYFCRLLAGPYGETKKLLLLR